MDKLDYGANVPMAAAKKETAQAVPQNSYYIKFLSFRIPIP